jgi:hypothetical protein
MPPEEMARATDPVPDTPGFCGKSTLSRMMVASSLEQPGIRQAGSAQARVNVPRQGRRLILLVFMMAFSRLIASELPR